MIARYLGSSEISQDSLIAQTSVTRDWYTTHTNGSKFKNQTKT